MKEKEIIRLMEMVRKEFREKPIESIKKMKKVKNLRVLAFVNLCVMTDTKWIDELCKKRESNH